jgi:endogenous inhibitor of DNA gyrase (YacG/DUF329 family)
MVRGIHKKVQCPTCGKEMDSDKLKRHSAVHLKPEKAVQPQEECPRCGLMVLRKNLQRHIAGAHRDAVQEELQAVQQEEPPAEEVQAEIPAAVLMPPPPPRMPLRQPEAPAALQMPPQPVEEFAPWKGVEYGPQESLWPEYRRLMDRYLEWSGAPLLSLEELIE